MTASQAPGEPGSQENGGEVTARGGLLRSSSVVSAMTLLSRVLGLVRDIVFARFLGASIAMDAFIVANRIPNMLRRFFAEGAFAQGFVPVMARYRESDDPAVARGFTDAVAGTFGLVLFIVTLVGVIAAPLLVLLVAPGFVGDDGRFDLATGMLRFTFPYLFFVSLVAFASSILNTYGRFAAPAFTPVILNIVLIVAAVWIAPTLDEPVMGIAYAVLVAGIVQLLFLLPFLAKVSSIPRPRWRPAHDGVRRVGRLMLPAIFGSSVAQLNVLLGGIIASVLGAGKISLLYYSDRLMEFPLGLFSIAIATVTLPYLSRQAADEDFNRFSETLDWSMRLVVLLVTPAALGLIFLAVPLVATIFYGGAFSESDVTLTAYSLQAFALGLIGFSFVKILAPAYFAREDTRTPVIMGLIALGVNVVLSIVLAFAISRAGYSATHAGLALAISFAAIVNAWLLYRGLQRDGLIVGTRNWLPFLLRVTASSTLMIVVVLLMQKPDAWWIAASHLERIVRLTMLIGSAVLVYFSVLLALGIRPHQFMVSERP